MLFWLLPCKETACPHKPPEEGRRVQNQSHSKFLCPFFPCRVAQWAAPNWKSITPITSSCKCLSRNWSLNSLDVSLLSSLPGLSFFLPAARLSTLEPALIAPCPCCSGSAAWALASVGKSSGTFVPIFGPVFIMTLCKSLVAFPKHFFKPFFQGFWCTSYVPSKVADSSDVFVLMVLGLL